MCTYQTENIAISASGKTAQGWSSLNGATIYFDHPVHFPAGHALMIDVHNAAKGPAARVALEMDATSAREFAHAILTALASVPEDLLASAVADEARSQ